jgi:hypothetical protein
MDMDQSAVFLAGSILTMLGFIIVVAGIIVINNLFSKYWKPITWIRYEDLPPRFVTREELAEQEQQSKK